MWNEYAAKAKGVLTEAGMWADWETSGTCVLVPIRVDRCDVLVAPACWV